MNNTYILLSRSLLNSEVFASQKLLKIWIWCLLKANYKDNFVPLKVGKGERTIEVKRGQFLFGRFKAEEELFIDGSTIYKAIKKLAEIGNISIQSNNQCSVITISNYDTYQDPKQYKVATKEQPKDSQVTAEGQPSNTTKEDKEGKECKEIDSKFDFKNSFLDLGVEKQILKDWLNVRKNKKATNSLTAFNKLKSKIELSGLSANECIKIAAENSWSGFDKEWIKTESQPKKKDRSENPLIYYTSMPMPLNQVTVDKDFRMDWLDMDGQKYPDWFIKEVKALGKWNEQV